MRAKRPSLKVVSTATPKPSFSADVDLLKHNARAREIAQTLRDARITYDELLARAAAFQYIAEHQIKLSGARFNDKYWATLRKHRVLVTGRKLGTNTMKARTQKKRDFVEEEVRALLKKDSHATNEGITNDILPKQARWDMDAKPYEWGGLFEVVKRIAAKVRRERIAAVK